MVAPVKMATPYLLSLELSQELTTNVEEVGAMLARGALKCCKKSLMSHTGRSQNAKKGRTVRDPAHEASDGEQGFY